MNNDVTIAPAGRVYPDPAQIPITDNIIDPVDAVFVKQKVAAIVPPTARKAPANLSVMQYQNLKMIHAGNQYANNLVDQYAIKGAILDKHPMFDVSTADTQKNNNIYLRGGII